jgi:hypothetical protein
MMRMSLELMKRKRKKEEKKNMYACMCTIYIDKMAIYTCM